MLTAIRGCWPLFLGVAFIMMGNGMQTTLLGIRANMEGFSTSVSGLVMSGYFLGFLLGSFLFPRIISRVGHVRVFGALASMASMAILVHAVIIDPWVWWFMRIVTGLSFAGLLIVSESWINSTSTNATRGKMMSVYMLVMTASIVIANLSVNLADPRGFELFTLVSVLIGFSVIPILLSVSKAPSIEFAERVSVKMLYKVSPLGVIAMFLTNFSQGTVFSMSAAYGATLDLDVKEISFLMSSFLGGALLFQWPIGWLSDRMDRRIVIAIVSLTSCIVGLIVSQYTQPGWTFFLAFFIFGGVSLPMYSLCIAYLNDYLSPKQMVAASGTMVLIASLGALSGPPIVALAMDYFNNSAFLWVTASAYGVIFLFALWRMSQSASIPMAEQGQHIILAPAPINPAPINAVPVNPALNTIDLSKKKYRAKYF